MKQNERRGAGNEAVPLRVIGLTGTIAAGKSTAARYLADRYGLVAIDADRVGHDALQQKDVQEKLKAAFGDTVVREGVTDRTELGRIVFSDAKKLEELNQITHPVISRMIREALAVHAKSNGASPVLIEAYGLLQSELADMVTEVWAVTADPAVRRSRVMKRQNLSEDEAEKRIKSQWSDDEYRQRADFVLDGSGTEEALFRQCDRAMEGHGDGHEIF